MQRARDPKAKGKGTCRVLERRIGGGVWCRMDESGGEDLDGRGFGWERVHLDDVDLSTWTKLNARKLFYLL